MALHAVHRLACVVALLAATTTQKDQSRWSRQISSYTADISDWVPLPGPVEREPPSPQPLPPIKRQAVAEPRILTEPFSGFTRPTGFGQELPPRNYFNSPANRQLYLQSVPSAPQNYLTEQGFGQSIRFGLSQPNFPLNQGFVAPQFTFDNVPAAPPVKPRQQLPSVLQNPIKFESFPKIPSNQAKPFINQGLPKLKPEAPKFVDGYRVENLTNDYTFNKKKVQSLQKLKYESFDKAPKIETIPPKQKVEREEVQLLYVPLESLNRGQFNFRSPITSSQLMNTDLYSQSLPKPNPLKQPFANEAPKPLVKPVDTYSTSQEYYSNFDAQRDDQVKYSTNASPFPTVAATTPKPKKLKPHQPPLAIFLTQDARKGNQIKVGDVLTSLKHADTIAVLDTVNPLNAPKVFIGPSTLTPPENYVRFELPYLSNIENTDKKLRQLPFFVAPLSYNTPQGFAKIPFPSPHVGSVVINSQIKDASPPAASVIPNSYTVAPQQHKQVTQKPSFTYYSTAAPNTNPPVPANQRPHYYSFEPQAVTAIPPQKEQTNAAPPKTGSYFLSNLDDQYNPQYINFPSDINQEPVRDYNIGNNKKVQPETTSTTPRTTVSTTTTKQPSTYSSQLLETHNPYSINQAFHFSTPLDYHSYYDEPFVTPGYNQGQKTSPTPASPPSSQPPKQEEVVTEKQTYYQQSSPNYVQNYSPEIHHEAEAPNYRYPVYNTNDYPSKPEVSSENNQNVNQPAAEPVQPEINQNYQYTSQETVGYNPPAYENLTETIINKITGPPSEVESPKPVYEQYETSQEGQQAQSASFQSSTSTTTTTTTRRTPLRTRGRPKYTTTPRTDSTETPTRSPVTRRPLRERRPLPPRNRYEPNKITTERATRKPAESGESTTKSTRTRTRGKVQFKPSESEDFYNKKNKGNYGNQKEDLAYQRDVLHQNYPVTLMERMSTVDIEAITEPSPKETSNKNFDSGTETYDAENAYTHEHSYIDNGSKENSPVYTSGAESQTESTNNEEYVYQTRSSSAPIQAISSYEDSFEKQEDKSSRQTTAAQRPEIISYATEPVSSVTEESQPSYPGSNEHSTKQEDAQSSEDIEITKVNSHEVNHETETVENVVQTTPSYNRVRVRPGVIRQYHQASSTESTRNKPERRKPVQAVTYRPAFDRRRTTMRIEEIEADLKTKQVHSRPEVQDYKHPVYRPEPTTEPAVTTASSADSNTKRGHFRRRRPVYTTTSTESSSTKKTYEVKNRFRGRRPTEKPTEKPEVQTDAAPTTTRNIAYNRYHTRPRLSERFNKKTEPEAEESEDQESNYSINRPKYVAPESEQWSPKISSDSFKPYNPNDIADDTKITPTEEKSDKDESDQDIITARNDYDDILISVTPATNNRGNKKLPDIPPTLEAYVEQSKTTKSDSADSMSTFETMLEEVMKSLEEQDEDEYTSNVMKHKGGEIGEIPPERIISSGEEVTQKPKTDEPEATTTVNTEEDSDYSSKDQTENKSRRRGYWKKVKVRPVTESIETAESQYYTNTVNRLGEAVPPSKLTHDKTSKYDKPRFSVTTYKPSFQFIKDFFDSEDDFPEDVLPTIDIPKIDKHAPEKKPVTEETYDKTEEIRTTEKTPSPGDMDLGTGSPDPTLMDSMYYSTPTEPTSSENVLSLLDRADGFSFMDYLFGVTDNKKVKNETTPDPTATTVATEVDINTEQPKSKATTTDSTYIPEEFTVTDDNTETVTEFTDIRKIDTVEPTETNPVVSFETSSESSFMNPANVVSTSMSTEISHETEICFRGKCIKTNKDLL
ncbi:mucin-2-like [Ostrinia nubilalis]|uniref:mucin-2-like n=1 Tax=Ostrinia nubilalis TaxID=29057 RepID=UPI00308257D9